jgi:hypothetical protein
VVSAPKLTRNRHARPVAEKWVFGAYDTERKIGWIKQIPDRSAETLLPLISDWFLPGTIVVSDGWAAYNRVHELGFEHEVVVHEHHFVDPITGVHTNAVEAYWQRCKRRFKRIFGTSYDLLGSHIDEFLWLERYGRRLSDRWTNWFECLVEL